MRLSIIVPVLNEAACIVAALDALGPLRRRGHEVIVVDGGSTDGTPELARGGADQVLAAPRGRASQMNAGARSASGEVFLFLHADTLLPAGADRVIEAGLAAGGRNRVWGRFDARIDGASPLLPVVAWFMNLRSRASGIATGDQAMFVRCEAFARVGGFPPLALMEDVAMSAGLKRLSPPVCLREIVVTSGRRWKRRGVLRMVLLMWWLRLRFFFGAAPARLARSYGSDRSSGGSVATATGGGIRVAVFAKAPIAGEVKTRLVPALGEQGAAALYRTLVARAVETAVGARIGPVELWCAPDAGHPFFAECSRRYGVKLMHQGEGDLGARMQRAFEKLPGATGRALLVGSDIPAMTPDYLRAAGAALAEGYDAVLGPAEDGGYVLIGLARADAGLFENIRWSASDVLAVTRSRIARLGWRHLELPTLWDVDRPEDLQREKVGEIIASAPLGPANS
jgi:rSAM/selenodomain-associated transferase 2/rSAM/selenodomain-associated transferase 1